MAKYGKRENYDLGLDLIASGVWRVDPEIGQILGFGRSTTKAWRPIGVVRDGYVRVRVGYQGPSLGVHRLIWEYVNGPSNLDLTINHKNGNTQDNRISNLELITAKENVIHARDVLGRCGGSKNVGSDNPAAKLTPQKVALIRGCVEAGIAKIVVAKEFGITAPTMTQISSYKTWENVTAYHDQDLIERLKSVPRGSAAKGSKTAKAKLMEEDVIQIRKLRREGHTPTQLAQKYNVSAASISNICAYRIWKHVP